MPRTNPRRRAALADAAIELLATAGLAGVTHRALDRAVGVPIGTAANYFRNRDELLAAAARRVAELHLAESERASLAAARSRDGTQLVDLLTTSLVDSATVHRERYLAIAELQLEARRRPGLASELAGLAAAAEVQVRSWHTALAAAGAPPEAVPPLIALYGGALLTLVIGPEQVDPAAVRALVETMVHGAVPGAGATAQGE